MRALIVDDEPLARRALRRMLESCAGVEVVGEACDGIEALGRLASTCADVLLLDIEMPRLAGMTLASQLRPQHAPAVIFVTAYPQHALHAFDVAAVDYLLKPVDPQRLAEALERAREQLLGRRAAQGVQAVGEVLRAMPAGPAGIDHVWVHYGHERRRLPLANVEWFGADGDYIQAHTAERSYLMRGPIGRLEARLPAHSFVRIHRSTLVNTEAVSAVSTGRGGGLVLITHGGARLAVGRRARSRVRRVLEGSAAGI
jgi:DNA-binding LytR/AlgR family response regulator